MSKKKYTQQKINTNKTKHIPIYTKEDHQYDENLFNKSMKNGNIDYANFKRLMIADIATHTNILNTGYIGNISVSDITNALQHPRRQWKTLIHLSRELMLISPHYFRMCNLYSNMALFCWWVDLYDVRENVKVSNVKKVYSNLTAKLENMNLKHEFSKIMKVLPYQDIYCGLVFENTTDFFFQEVDYKMCELYQIQDGLYNFRMDLSQINPINIDAYPDYVQQAWVDLKDGKVRTNWYEPPADKQICVKLNSQWLFPYPILIGLIKDILDLDVYKQLKLQSARTDNYKAIAIEVPIDKNTIDKPLLTPNTLGVFAEINRESMSDDIGMIHTLGSNATPISFKDSNNTRNNVSDAVDELYNASGITKELYNGSSSGTAVGMSIENDSGFVYGLYRQLERWVNRFIKTRKYNKSTFKFFFYLLDVTIFNRDNVSKRYKEAASMGLSVVDKWMATLDMTPSRTLGSFMLHKDIFDFQNNFVPLQSSFNSSQNVNSEDNKGRPTNKSKGESLDVSGEKTEDLDSNKDR